MTTLHVLSVPGDPRADGATEDAALACAAAVRPGDAVALLGHGEHQMIARAFGFPRAFSVGAPRSAHRVAALAEHLSTETITGWGQHAEQAAQHAASVARIDFQPGDIDGSVGTNPAPLRRADLGIGADQLAVASFVSRPDAIDLTRLLIIIGVLELAEQPVTVIAHPRAIGVADTRAFINDAGLRMRLILTEEPLARVIPAVDMLLEDESAPASVRPGAPLRALAAQAGTPIEQVGASSVYAARLDLRDALHRPAAFLSSRRPAQKARA